ncbi:MAG: 30S ribosomal protein S2 [Candidatus Hodgkinia cicadicola]|nr:MAG: 30S ribosomal protein S2 [Candidatus Hodgkinia cicadicola]
MEDCLQTRRLKHSAVSADALIRLGVHYGHKITLLKPVMRPYIVGAWHGVNVINVDRTLTALEFALNVVFEAVCSNKRVLFVCTGLNTPFAAAQVLANAGQYCVTGGFGGMLSNWLTFRTVGARLERYRRVIESLKNKRLIACYNRKARRASNMFVSPPEVEGLPGAVVLFCDANYTSLAAEASKLEVPIIGLADSFSDVEGVSCVVPVCGGSDSVNDFFCKLFASVCEHAALISDKARLAGFLMSSNCMPCSDLSCSQVLSVACCHFKSVYFTTSAPENASAVARAVKALDLKLAMKALLSLVYELALPSDTTLRCVISLCKLKLCCANLCFAKLERLRKLVGWLECLHGLVSLKEAIDDSAISSLFGVIKKPEVDMDELMPTSTSIGNVHIDFHAARFPNFDVTNTYDHFFAIGKTSVQAVA